MSKKQSSGDSHSGVSKKDKNGNSYTQVVEYVVVDGKSVPSDTDPKLAVIS